MTAAPRVLETLEQGVLTATLNRPDKRNAIDEAMIERLLQVLERADLDAAVRVVVLRGAGPDFCAGMDLAELLASADRSVALNREAALRFGGIFLQMRRMPKPVVAVVQGRALAGGCGLATACDIVVAAKSAQFGYPEVHEHDTERAIRAGLELCAAVRTLRLDAGVPMRCRVGIATGMVIIGDLVAVRDGRDH
jgi:methylglutaconyl-CoA hydratase